MNIFFIALSYALISLIIPSVTGGQGQQTRQWGEMRFMNPVKVKMTAFFYYYFNPEIIEKVEAEFTHQHYDFSSRNLVRRAICKKVSVVLEADSMMDIFTAALPDTRFVLDRVIMTHVKLNSVFIYLKMEPMDVSEHFYLYVGKHPRPSY